MIRNEEMSITAGNLVEINTVIICYMITKSEGRDSFTNLYITKHIGSKIYFIFEYPICWNYSCAMV